MLIPAGCLAGVPQANPRPLQRAQRDFSIPAQSMVTALEAFVAQSGIQVLYDAPPDRSIASPGVKGHMQPHEALSRLLAGTGFSARPAGNGAIVLSRSGRVKSGATAAPGATGGTPAGMTLVLDPLVVVVPPARTVFASYDFYGSVVQNDIEAALRRDAETRGRRYQIRLRLWIGGSGQITDSRLVASTGNSKLDQAIGDVIRRTVIRTAPPRNLPQPVRVYVSVT